MRTKKTVSMKVAVLMMAAVLLIGCTVGGSLAWLMTKTNTVTNTFVAGNIGTLTLSEKSTEITADTTNNYTIVPGVNITKDPKITFNGNNVKAYVFVKVEATGWTCSDSTYTIDSDADTSTGMSWTIADGWTPVNGVANVYYRIVNADSDTTTTATTESYDIIKGNTISVSSGITQESISDYTKNLIFTGYAIQADGHTGDDDNAKILAAWNAVSGSN
ncbi:MAG: hypothetical protein IKK03_04945 [Lachnospiraceae bacterium]|nr:hypothetical protein [Lachnospiraceae bacterium]MBR4059171.1 hypothetical protein [Lachnospiraceae bacterium]